MLSIFVIFGFAIAACLSNAPLTPLTTPAPIRCGYTPSNIFKCIGNPKVIKSDVAGDCGNSATECEKMKCIFRKLGWLDHDKVNRAKVTAHFDQYARDHPEWSPAVQQLKTTCLAEDIPAQGVLVNCPAYDILTCCLSEFIKNAQPSQWSSSPDCVYPRQFAAACPVCPEQCFAPFVPNGSCNACILLPRSP